MIDGDATGLTLAARPRLLEALQLDVELGSTAALRSIDLAFEPGWTAVVGPNGAGKSTLLRTLAGLLRPAAGSVTLNGRALDDMTARERGRSIAWLAQQGESGTELTVREVVRLGRLPWHGLFDAPGPDDEAAVERALQATGCHAWHERRLDQLSGGERQRVLVARALAVEAPVLLLDEPTTHVDALHQVALLRILHRLAAEGRTVVSALHDLTLAFAADRIVLLQGGRVRVVAEADDTTLHRAMVDVFDGAIRIERIGARWVVVPDLEMATTGWSRDIVDPGTERHVRGLFSER